MLQHFVSCSPGVRHASGIIFAPGTCTGDLQSICIFSVDCISSEFRFERADRVTGGCRRICTCKVAFSAGQWLPNMLLLSPQQSSSSTFLNPSQLSVQCFTEVQIVSISCKRHSCEKFPIIHFEDPTPQKSGKLLLVFYFQHMCYYTCQHVSLYKCTTTI